MDPNVALANILTGVMIGDHAEALEGWLTRGGFEPHERTLPDASDCAVFARKFARRHCPGVELAKIRVRANADGLWAAAPDRPWLSLALWPELARMAM